MLKERDATCPPAAPAVSVIIAYEDPRAKAEHVRTWTVGQTFPGEQYEVIVVTDGAHPEVEAEIIQYLRPQDVLVCSQGTERFLLCNVGAQVARSEVFFFTEDHCLAEPGGVALAARALGEQRSGCVTIGWGNINDTFVGRFEERVTTKNMDIWHGPDHWNTLRARGFVISRQAFDQAGRFPAGYGIFAEALFTARLHESGVRTGYTPEVGVRHINSESLTDLAGNAWHYSHYECLAATRCEAKFFDRYFDRSQVLLSKTIPPTEARVARSLIHREWSRECFPKDVRPRRWIRIRSWTHLYLRTVATQHGGSLCRAAAKAGELWNAFTCRWWRLHEARRFAAFSQWWRAVVKHARVDFLTRGYRHLAPLANTPGSYAGASLRLLHGWGLHGLESAGDRHIRWTGPLAVIPLRLPPGECEITLDSGGCRGGDCHFPFVIYWDRHRVARRDLQYSGSAVTFRAISKAKGEHGVQRLVLLVPQTLQTDTERRPLGFPLAGFNVAMVGADSAVSSLHDHAKTDAAIPLFSP